MMTNIKWEKLYLGIIYVTDSYILKRNISALLYILNVLFKVHIMIYFYRSMKNLIIKHHYSPIKKKQLMQ